MGDSVVGSPYIAVTKSGAPYRQGSATVTSSAYTAGESFELNTKDTYSTIAFWAGYMSGGYYQGVMQIISDEGNTNLTTRCTIK